MSKKESTEEHVKSIRRATRKQYSSEEKIRIVLEGLRGEQSIAELRRREQIAQSLYYAWSKEFLEAGKKRLSTQSPAGRRRIPTVATSIDKTSPNVPAIARTSPAPASGPVCRNTPTGNRKAQSASVAANRFRVASENPSE